MSKSLRPHARLPCPSPPLGVCSNSRPLSWWCHPIISFFVVPFFSCLQSFLASESSLMSNKLAPAVQGMLKSLFQHHSSKASILQCSAFYIVQLSHSYMTTGKTITLTIRTFVGKVMLLLFNTPSRFVPAFLPRSKRLLISWLQLPSTVILSPRK